MAKPLKVGLVGTGSISRAHLPAYQQFPEEVKLTAVCDIREEAAQRYAEKAGVDEVYTDLDKMLKEADIDAVDVCTIHDQHEHQAIAAAAAGKHILLEKPMAISVQQCRNILTATDKAGVTFMVAQVLRYLPQSQMAHRLIQEGEIGPVWAVRSDDLHCSFPPKSELKDAPPPDKPSSWYFDGNRAGGGALITFATHSIDLLRYYLGDIKRVTGTCYTDHPMFFNGADDRTHATVEFENGAVGNLSSSFTTRSPWMHRYWVYGESGTICSAPNLDGHGAEQHHAPVEVSSPNYGEVRAGMGGSRFEAVDGAAMGLPTGQAFTNEILHFADCCREGKEPLSSGKDNLGTMKAVFGIYESARTGKPIELASL